MIIPQDITETAITLKDQYFDLRGLSAYSALGVSTLREYIREGKLPAYRIKGKVLIKKSEFDGWIEGHRMNQKKDIEKIADDIIKTIKMN